VNSSPPSRARTEIFEAAPETSQPAASKFRGIRFAGFLWRLRAAQNIRSLLVDRETELGEFVIDCYGPDPFDRFFEHEVRSEKRLMVRQIAAPQSALQAHRLCYGQTPDRVIARDAEEWEVRKVIDRGEYRISRGDKPIVDVGQKAHPMPYAISRMKSVSLIVDSRKATYVEGFRVEIG
jgi:hypothetical protein